MALAKELTVCLHVEERLVTLPLELGLANSFFVNLKQLLVFEDFCKHRPLFVDQISMGEREVVDAIEAVHAELLILPLLLLFSEHAVGHIKCLTLEVPVDSVTLKLLE